MSRRPDLLVGDDRAALALGHPGQRREEQGERAGHGRQDEQQEDRRQRGQPDHGADHRDQKRLHHQQPRGVGLAGDLHLLGQSRDPGGLGGSARRRRAVQRGADRAGHELVAERLDDGRQAQERLSRGDAACDHAHGEQAQPCEPGGRVSGQEALVDRPRDEQARQERGRSLDQRPRRQPDHVGVGAAQRSAQQAPDLAAPLRRGHEWLPWLPLVPLTCRVEGARSSGANSAR